jgi:hypothetical protein
MLMNELASLGSGEFTSPSLDQTDSPARRIGRVRTERLDRLCVSHDILEASTAWQDVPWDQGHWANRKGSK